MVSSVKGDWGGEGMDGLPSSRSVDVNRGGVDRDKGDWGGEDCGKELIWKQIKEWRGTDEKMMSTKKYGKSFSDYLITMSVMD